MCRPTADDLALYERAREVRERAYAPYSEFPVGAVLIAEDGRAFEGVNVENGSFGLTVCAERTAVFKAISEGAKGFRAVAVVTDAEPPASPCGACRQVLWDQCRDVDVVIATPRGIATRTRLSALLPLAFEF